LPSRFSWGTRTSSRFTTAVGCDFHPIFFSFAPNDRPAKRHVKQRRSRWGSASYECPSR
jgi:hypothetical protein